MREACRAGRDPLRERRQLRQSRTMADLLDAYVESARFKAKTEQTQAIDRGRIERHLKPTLGREYAHTLTRDDVERAFAAIRDGKTACDETTENPRGRARVTGGPGAARMAIDLLRAAFNWAKGQGLAAANPCEHVETGSSRTHDAILEDATQHARLFKTLARMENEKRIREPVADAIRLIALTGARRGEVAGLLWDHVDLKRGLLTLPPAAHKTGRKTGGPRVIGLPAAAQAVIARQPEGEADDYVFARSKGSLASTLSHAFAEMRGASAPEIMTVLGHRQLSTVQRYIHFAEGAHRDLAERAAAVAVAGLAESTRDDAAEVVDLSKTRGKK